MGVNGPESAGLDQATSPQSKGMIAEQLLCARLRVQVKWHRDPVSEETPSSPREAKISKTSPIPWT